ncbi:hypothetical protein FOZ60_000612 [Perkinsus olseni]|uniref:subtilisin n=1 Tax=Perkinsus olseni TaxID=32597 RepID=A0A7J6P2V1_PEROL|nr:hypothetical protein FOZ60_000612 [Perkinsus olseni]
MRILHATSLTALIASTVSTSDTIVSIKSGVEDVNILRLPRMLRDAAYMPDQKIVSFLDTAKITTLGYVHSQVVQTSAVTVDSETLCSFVAMASNQLSLQSECGEDVDGDAFGLTDSTLQVNDADARYQKHLEWMKMGEVWRLSSPHVTRTVKVAVTDSGIDWTDPDFAPLKGTLKKKSGGYLEGGWNFFTNSSILTYKDPHGTEVCKVLAAKSNNSVGIAGVAPNVRLVPLQMVDDNKKMPLSKFLAALNMAIDLEVDIISMSVGYYFVNYRSNTTAQFRRLWEALRVAQESGILLVSASGYYTTYMQDNKTRNVLDTFSGYGERVDVAAYGKNIFTGFDKNGNPKYFNGSSAATPIVAGLAAILLSMDVEPSMVKRLILANVDPVECEMPVLMPQTIRGGAINALRTVQHAISWLSSRPRALRGNDAFDVDK